MTPRLRVIRYTVQIEAVLDDGENLTPVPTQPIQVNASQWTGFVEHGLIDGLAQLESTLLPPAEDEQQPDT